MAVTKKKIIQALPLCAAAAFLIALILLSVSGCSQKKDDFQGMPRIGRMQDGMQREGFPGGFNRTGFNETQMKEMAAEREKLMSAACVDKAEGDSCTLQSPRGEAAGTCKPDNGALICSITFGERQMPPRETQ